MPFPLTPVPSYYATITHVGRSGIYYVGGTVSVTLSQPTPTNYSVNDYYGNVIETGSVNGTALSLRGPFNPGWYRVYMTGAHTDVTFGPSYGAWAFMVVPNDSRFATNPAVGVGVGQNQGGGEAHDSVMKSVLGMGLVRIQVADASNPTTGIDNTVHAQQNSALLDTYWYNAPDPAFDANRGRGGKYLQFPNRCYDRVDIANSGFARVYCKDGTIDGSQVFVEVVTGTTGSKVNIYSPNSSTLVESYDNLLNGTDLQTATATSNYVRAFNSGSVHVLLAPTAIGNVFKNGVTLTVQTLYPNGYLYYEGPINEQNLNAELAHRMNLFQAAVKLGNADAKAIGPCPVDIHGLTGSVSWDAFLAAGGANYCDEFSFHAYNSQTNGDINLGRSSWENFIDLLTSYGVDDKPRWHTEATHVFNAVYGVNHPRRSGVPIRQTLVAEQYGLPREKNLVWYDRSHGFWSYPSFLMDPTNSPVPYAVMYRNLAAETFGMTHYHRLDFGHEAANRIWMGSLYVQNKKSLGPSCLVLCMNSNMPGATVDLTISGSTSAITYVDAFGNTATASQTSGRVTIPTSEIPTYVRLPAGVTATVYQVNDWGTSPPPSISSYGSATAAQMNDDQFLSSYSAPQTGVFISSRALPDQAQIIFLANATMQRIVIFSGGTWQNLSALTTFTVDTWDGASWTTQKTVDVSAVCTSFQHGSDANGMGCKQETYWPEQWIFDVNFPAPVTALGVRINATGCSYGGEPDAAAKAAGGQGSVAPVISLQEVMVLSTSTPGF